MPKSGFGIVPHFFTLFPIASLPSSQVSRQPMSQSALNITRAILSKPFLTPKVFHVPKQNAFSHHNLKNNNSIKAIILSMMLIKPLQRNKSDSNKSC